jgi:hypothetical protein
MPSLHLRRKRCCTSINQCALTSDIQAAFDVELPVEEEEESAVALEDESLDDSLDQPKATPQLPLDVSSMLPSTHHCSSASLHAVQKLLEYLTSSSHWSVI